MAPDNRLQYNRLLANSQDAIGRVVGRNHAFNGRTIYGFEKPSFKEKEVTLELDGSKLIATLKYVKDISLGNIVNGDNR